MSGLVKGVKKAVKGVIKGVKKVFKKLTSSIIGKVILASIVIYTGGVLTGAWGSTGPMSGMFNYFGLNTAAATAAASDAALAGAVGTGEVAMAGMSAETMAAGEAAVSNMAATNTVAGTVGTNATTSIMDTSMLSGGGSGSYGTAAGKIGGIVQSGSAGGVIGGGVIGGGIIPPTTPSFLSQASTWAENNSLLASTAFEAAAGAMAPDEEDMMKMKEDAERRRWSSLSGNISLGMTPSGNNQLLDSSGVPWHERLTRSRGG